MDMQSSSTVAQQGNDAEKFPIVVLLVDDQQIIGEGVRQMLAKENDITFHYCSDPTLALETALKVQPTVILQDLVMPDIDGLTLVKFYRANAATRMIPLIVLSSKEEPVIKAQAFALGANDYLVKLPDQVELLARIRYHSNSYIRLLERNQAYADLAESRRHMAEEIEAGAKFLYSLLPAPTSKPVQIDWRYIPCSQLAGDTLGYNWIDPDHLGFYVLDVCGHGIASALLSVSIMNLLRSQSLPNVDFRDPGQVLTALNPTFPFEDYGSKFYTIWYGVYCKSESKLSWSGGGHPEALLFEPSGGTTPVRLDSKGGLMGIMEDEVYATASRVVEPGSRLFLYTDGAHEIHKKDGTEWQFEEFVTYMGQASQSQGPVMEGLLAHVRELSGSQSLPDDFTMIEVKF
jgi:sigma-B regulation protein RsbU (phosphoserine phosphatase)